MTPHEHELTDDELRLATTRELPERAALDGTAAASHADFLTLGAAIDAANGEFDEDAFLARLKPTCIAADQLQRANEANVVALPERKPKHSDLGLFRIVLAAAAMIAAGWLLFVFLHVEPAEPGPSQRNAVVENNILPGTDEAIARWHDPLDDEIEVAAATLDQIADYPTPLDDSLLDMNVRLKALSQELNGGSL